VKVQERTKELHEKNEELAQLQELRTKWLANIAHDLGSPMGGVQTCLKLMQQRVVPTGDNEFIQHLFGKSNDMKRLIDDLFELSKLETGQVPFDYKQVSVRRFIQEAYDKFIPDVERESMQLKLGMIQTVSKDKEV